MKKLVQQHTITVLVENKPGVLARVSGLFARRGFNIESLAVSNTNDPTMSRMTIVVSGDDRILDQIIKQTSKLIDVIRVIDYSEVPILERELALLKVNAKSAKRAEIMQITDIFRAKIVDISDTTFTIEVTGSVDKVDALERLLEPYGIKEIVRTGKIALSRGAHSMVEEPEMEVVETDA
ncbi:MAG: acetolactate synthase small subunit [Armatimonadota bacterium]